MVTVKPLAYYKMLVHILRFGNKARDRRQFKEVMGILIGRLEGAGEVKNVIVEDAVPISHGGSIEVAFKPEDYVSFSYVDAEYAEQDPPLFSVGWYHSHPALRIFFSSTDIKNQLGWQVPNPSAIGIVFDHTYLENPGDPGFRTFRLDDPNKGPMADYHEVKSIVQPPDSIEYYIKIMQIISSIHAKEPAILEINETPDLFGDISMPGQSQIMAKQPELELTELLENLQKGMNSLIESTMTPMVRFLNNWSQAMIKSIIDNNLQIRTDLVALRDNISTGMSEVQGAFKSLLSNKLYDLDSYIDDRLEGFDKDQEAIKAGIGQIKEKLLQQVSSLFEESINSIINPLIVSMDENKKKLNIISDTSSKNAANLATQSTTIEGMPDKIKTIKTSVSTAVSKAQEKIKKSISDQVGIATKEINSLSKDLRELTADLDAALSILESSTKTIKNKLTKTQGGGA